MNEKIEFSNRLRATMVKAGYTASPAVLLHGFNLRWHGRSISNQAAWSWLNSKSIPTQDKIQVLAEWLKIEPQLLRFGESVLKAVQEHQKRWDEGLGHIERETVEAFLKLPAPERKIIREVIQAFAKAKHAIDETAKI